MRIKTLCVCLAVLLWLPVSVSAVEAVSSQTLIDNAAAYDGKTVQFQGEAVGDVLARRTHAWLCLSDGSNSTMSLFVTSADAEKVQILGGYARTGDVLRVEGVFHRACADHGGDMDIHATGVERIADGYAVTHPVSGLLALCAGLALVAAVTLTVLVCKLRSN